MNSKPAGLLETLIDLEAWRHNQPATSRRSWERSRNAYAILCRSLTSNLRARTFLLAGLTQATAKLLFWNSKSVFTMPVWLGLPGSKNNARIKLQRCLKPAEGTFAAGRRGEVVHLHLCMSSERIPPTMQASGKVRGRAAQAMNEQYSGAVPRTFVVGSAGSDILGG